MRLRRLWRLVLLAVITGLAITMLGGIVLGGDEEEFLLAAGLESGAVVLLLTSHEPRTGE
jgi:hypothetical protein